MQMSISNPPKMSGLGNFMSAHYNSRKCYNRMVQSVHETRSAVLFSGIHV